MQVGVCHDLIGQIKETHLALVPLVPHGQLIHLSLDVMLDGFGVHGGQHRGGKTDPFSTVLHFQLLNQLAHNVDLLDREGVLVRDDSLDLVEDFLESGLSACTHIIYNYTQSLHNQLQHINAGQSSAATHLRHFLLRLADHGLLLA